MENVESRDWTDSSYERQVEVKRRIGRGSRLVTLGLGGTAGLMVLALSAASALGATSTWKNGPLAAQTRDAGPSISNFTASAAWADSGAHLIRTGAHLAGSWTLYAGFTEGWGYSCHSYSGANTLGALIENPHSVSQNPVLATYQWGGPGC